MNYLLDTNTLSDLYNPESDNNKKICKKFFALSQNDDVFYSILSLYELEYGFENAPELMKLKIRNKIKDIKNELKMFSFPEIGASHFGKLKNAYVKIMKLKKEEAKKHNIDLIFASHAVLESCILVSSDKIYNTLVTIDSRLKVENWT